MAAALATTVTTWSLQYAAAQAAYETRTAATADAQYDKRVDQSIAQGNRI